MHIFYLDSTGFFILSLYNPWPDKNNKGTFQSAFIIYRSSSVFIIADNKTQNLGDGVRKALRQGDGWALEPIFFWELLGKLTI